ncbi:serine/threonine-protein phosphatase 6 regulatory ankyrin repeat subunit B-like [Macrobrachium rosenbergii]|uniref:serine/threonine-protein phosphatase 6 regulatory ankyrin repeat subunit B-like n=1 Tax=Macrobrachium rosenbergii TaxID=79674 RepID=UPI0034D6148E
MKILLAMNGSLRIFCILMYLLCSWMVEDVECYLVYKGELNPPCKKLTGLRLDEYRACKGYLLIVAITKGKLKDAKRLLEDESDAPYVVAFKDKTEKTYGFTALIWAAKKNYTELVKLLVQKGAKVNHASGGNYTALYYSVKNRNKECVALLLTKGADPNIFPRGGNSPLLDAAWNDCFDMAKLLLDNEADPNSMTEGSNVTSLMIATAYGHKAVVQTLLNSRANPNVKDNRDMTPLHKAAYYGHLDILRLLLTKGAKVDAVDKKNRTALHEGCRKGQKDIVREIVKHCPDDKIRNIYGRTALEEARFRVKVLQKIPKKAGKDTRRTDLLKNVITILEGYKSSSCRNG